MKSLKQGGFLWLLLSLLFFLAWAFLTLFVLFFLDFFVCTVLAVVIGTLHQRSPVREEGMWLLVLQALSSVPARLWVVGMSEGGGKNEYLTESFKRHESMNVCYEILIIKVYT
jgi:hypothetical protein